jgi:competence protein ComEA
MLSSLLVKLGMLVVTMGVVFWIGWTVPQSRFVEAGQEADRRASEETRVRSAGQTAVSASDPAPLAAQPHGSSGVLQQPVPPKLDVNRATEQELEALPGIGPVLAERIVEYRQSRGAFRDVEQLRNVKGIGKKKFDRIRTLIGVTVPSVPVPGGRKVT